MQRFNYQEFLAVLGSILLSFAVGCWCGGSRVEPQSVAPVRMPRVILPEMGQWR